MNAIELFHQDGKPTGIFYCEKCRVVHRDRTAADQCCVPPVCACGKPCQRFCSMCPDCDRKRWTAIEQEREVTRFEKAKKLEADTYEGPVQPPHSDEYYESVEAYLDYCHDEGLDPGTYVWACTVSPVITLQADDIIEDKIERQLDELPEDWDSDTLVGVEDLQKACDAFNAANSGNRVWILDHSRAVILPPIQT